MIRGLIPVLCIALAVEAISAYEVAVPVFRQPYGTGDSTKIVGGQTATKGQFPHQAGIVIDRNAFCGGSLISKGFVLTAGHCVSGFGEWVVDLGAYQINEDLEPGRRRYFAEQAVHHEKYDEETLANDIGLITLPYDAKLSDTVNIIALPPRSYQHENFVGQSVRVSGWGRTSDSSTSLNPTLQFVDLTLISLEECRKTYGDVITADRYCCSGAEKKSTCDGDSGGALTMGSGKNLTNVGIVSFGAAAGCSMGYPVGFTAVAFFVDWISNQTGIPVQDF